MSGLIKNDLYNILHNAKQMLLIVVIWGFCFSGGAEEGTYMPMFSILFCMMTITTFSFDEKCGWIKYAMILPGDRKNYVLAKYIVTIIFALTGTLTGIVTTAVTIVIKGAEFSRVLVGSSVAGLSIAIFFGSFVIPLLIKYGTEKARVIMFGAILFPLILVFLMQRIMEEFQITISPQMIEKMIYIAPIVVLVFMVAMYMVSCRIMERKEF